MQGYDKMRFIKVKGRWGWLFREIANPEHFLFRENPITAPTSMEAVRRLRVTEGGETDEWNKISCSGGD